MSTDLASWKRTWHELGAQEVDELLHHRLIACWSEGHRRYHTLQHLGECLDLLDDVRAHARRPAEVALALWFHDAFYEPHRGDNEERSAQWARISIQQAGLSDEVADRVHGLVMTTRHGGVPQEPDARLMVDIDLAILGAEPSRFDEYERQIRAEYAHLADGEFRAGRRRLLERLAGRPTIYCTGHFQQELEQRARQNLQRGLARWQAS
jgi:predicted metal-dependent HD superfamily phosphohydrolase